MGFQWVENKKKKNEIKELDSLIKEGRKTKESLKKELEVLRDQRDKLEEQGKALRDVDLIKFKLEVKSFWNIILDKFKGDKTVIVNMELTNGFHKTFLVLEKDGGFRFNKKRYLFDVDLKYYNVSSKMWMYDFNENYVLPVRRLIPVSDIKKAIKYSGVSEVEAQTNPAVLDDYVKSKIAQGVFQGGKLQDWVRQIKIMMIILVVLAIFHLILFMQKTGVFEQLQGMF